MEAILKFNLDDPDDCMSHLRAVKSLDMALALSDIAYLWHKVDKMCDTKEYDEDPREWWSKQIIEILEDKGINIDELVC